LPGLVTTVTLRRALAEFQQSIITVRLPSSTGPGSAQHIPRIPFPDVVNRFDTENAVFRQPVLAQPPSAPCLR
jgi:hypothetical protein